MKRGTEYNMVNWLRGALMGCAAVVVLAFTSCVQDVDNMSPILPEEDALVSLSLNLPALTLQETVLPETDEALSRAMSSTDEANVQTIDVLAFKGGKYVYSARKEGGITSNGNIKTFTITLRKGTGYDLVIFANAKNIIDAAGDAISSGKPKAEVLDILNMKIDGKWNAATGAPTLIPMSSDPDGSNLLNLNIVEGMSITDINIYRMLAQVQVTLGIKNGVQAKNLFNLKSVHVYNRNTDGLLKSAFSNNDYVLNAKPSRMEDPLVYDNQDGRTEITAELGKGISCKNEIYLFEAGNTASDLTFITRPCLVIGGVYSTNATTSYYRVDFSTDATTYLNILRNHIYAVNIIAVSGRGYDTPDQAFRSTPINMTAQVVAWDESNINVASDGQYSLGVNRKEFTIPKEANSWTYPMYKMEATTNYPNEWTVNVMEGNNVATSGWLKVRRESATVGVYAITLPAGTTQQGFYLQTEENTTGNPRTAIIHVTAGKIKQVIRVTQSVQSNMDVLLTLNTTEVTQLTWYGTDVAQKTLMASWIPVRVPCTITSAALSGGGFVYSGASPFGATTTQVGIQDYEITPAAISTSTTGYPFVDRSSTVVFTMNYGEKAISKSVQLRQVNYAIVPVVGALWMNGTQQSIRIRANFPWRVELQSTTADKSAYNNLVVSTLNVQYGGPNTTNGDLVNFTLYDYMSTYNAAYPGKGTITLKFSRLENGQWVPFDQTVSFDCFAPIRVGPSNTYMINSVSPSVIAIPTSQVQYAMNGTAGMGTGFLGTDWIKNYSNLKVQVLWSDETLDVTNAANVVKSVTFNGAANFNDLANGYITVQPGDGVGNSLIILYEDNNGVAGFNNTTTDVIRWSWLIWKTPYFPYQAGTYPSTNPTPVASGTNGKWMDRNIGARYNVYNSNSSQTMGFFFQWGRKDPFPSNSSWGNTFNNYLNYASGAFGEASTPSNNNLGNAVANPIVRYYYNPGIIPLVNSADWFTNGTLLSQNSDLWGALGTSNFLYPAKNGNRKSVYDPCPEGYRVPKSGEWTSSGWASAVATTGSYQYGQYSVSHGGYYPAGGLRSATAAGTLSDVTTTGYYWTASAFLNLWSNVYLRFSGSTVNTAFSIDNSRAAAMTVRCVTQ